METWVPGQPGVQQRLKRPLAGQVGWGAEVPGSLGRSRRLKWKHDSEGFQWCLRGDGVLGGRLIKRRVGVRSRDRQRSGGRKFRGDSGNRDQREEARGESPRGVRGRGGRRG